MRLTSGPLQYSEAKGLHRCDADFSIALGSDFFDQAFRLTGPDGKEIASMSTLGWITARESYLWDGSSGPTLDGEADPVPSLVHDVLYEAMRAGKLSTHMRGKADGIYYDLLRERGMGWWRAGARWLGLRLFAGYAASPKRGAEYPKRTAA